MPLLNHVVFIVDRSSSMHGIRFEVVKQFNQQLATIREQSTLANQKTKVSLYTFSSQVDKALIFDGDVRNVRDLSTESYNPNGMTALLDAVGLAIEDHQRVENADDPDVSFLFLVITDGAENQSRRYNTARLQQLMGKVVATDRWSFAFLCPASGVSALQRLGVPGGNIQPWEATARGVEISTVQTQSAMAGYYSARTAGARSTRSFFKPDMTNVKPEELKKKLKDVSGDYLRLNVTDDARIDEFVVKTTGGTYTKSSGYYQLTKPEDVQEYKKIIIQDIRTNVLYSGPVRTMLGMPDYGTTRVHPGNHAEYNIFIESTSYNRKLIGGTSFLLKKNV